MASAGYGESEAGIGHVQFTRRGRCADRDRRDDGMVDAVYFQNSVHFVVVESTQNDMRKSKGDRR
jgi:hypothetical protein